MSTSSVSKPPAGPTTQTSLGSFSPSVFSVSTSNTPSPTSSQAVEAWTFTTGTVVEWCEAAVGGKQTSCQPSPPPVSHQHSHPKDFHLSILHSSVLNLEARSCRNSGLCSHSDRVKRYSQSYSLASVRLILSLLLVRHNRWPRFPCQFDLWMAAELQRYSRSTCRRRSQQPQVRRCMLDIP